MNCDLPIGGLRAMLYKFKEEYLADEPDPDIIVVTGGIVTQ